MSRTGDRDGDGDGEIKAGAESVKADPSLSSSSSSGLKEREDGSVRIGLVSRPKEERYQSVSTAQVENLLSLQKGKNQEELEQALTTQRSLTSELQELTDMIKNTSLRIQETVKLQTNDLVTIQEASTLNVEEIAKQVESMNKKETEMQSSIFTTIINLVLFLGLFLITILVIRFFPKP